MAVPLPEIYRDKIKWHLARIQEGIPQGNLARLNDAVGTSTTIGEVPNTWSRCKIFELCDQCDYAWDEVIKITTGLETTKSEIYTGDINRTVTAADNSKGTRKDKWETYVWCVDQLSRALWCPEFTTGNNDPFRHSASLKGQNTIAIE